MKIVNGTYYHEDTPDEVIHILETARDLGYTVRLFYGDKDTGRDWMEECDMHGRVSRSMGPICIPILLANSRSLGGPGILDHCIVRIQMKRGRRGGFYHGPMREWKHPNYRTPVLDVVQDDAVEGYHWKVTLSDGTTQARFRKFDQAVRYKNFIEGRRMGR